MNTQKIYTASKNIQPNTCVRAYYHDISNGDISTIHTHDFHELNIIISGSGIHYVNDSEFHITCGDIFIIPPGVGHGYKFDSDNYSIFHILFRNRFFEKYKSVLDNLSGYQILFNIDPQLRKFNNTITDFLHIDMAKNYNLTRTFNELVALQTEQNITTENEKELLALYIIAKICGVLHKKKNISKENKRYLYDILKSVEYIHLNFGSKIEIDTLLKISCMSRSSYIRYFKKIFNSTPIDYIHNYRLRQSKALLKYTDAPLSSIAIDCGFYDSSHYGKLFREKYQMTPAQYRLASKNDGSKMGLSENSSLE